MQDPFPPHTVLKIVLLMAHAFSDFFPIFLNPFSVLQETPPPSLLAAWALLVVPNKPKYHRGVLL